MPAAPLAPLALEVIKWVVSHVPPLLASSTPSMLTDPRPPLSRPPRKVTPAEIALNAAGTAIAVAASAAEFTPVPYVQHLCSLAASILKAIETVKDNKAAFKGLANETYEIVIAVRSMAEEGRTMSFRMKGNLEDLVETLTEIQYFSRTLASRTFVRRMVMRQADASQVKEFRARIRHCVTLFELKTQIRTHENVLEMLEKLNRLQLTPRSSTAYAPERDWPTPPTAKASGTYPEPLASHQPPTPPRLTVPMNPSQQSAAGTQSLDGDTSTRTPLQFPASPAPPSSSIPMPHPFGPTPSPPWELPRTASLPPPPPPSSLLGSTFQTGSSGAPYFGPYSTITIGGKFTSNVVHGTQTNHNYA